LKSYAASAAETVGQSRRAVERDLYRAKEIDPEVLADVSGTPQDKGVVLDALAATPRPEQRAKLQEITQRHQEASEVNRGADRAIRDIAAQQWAEWIMARAAERDVHPIMERHPLG
jgi:hypothetical protein